MIYIYIIILVLIIIILLFTLNTSNDFFTNNNNIICFLTVKPSELYYNECKKLLNKKYDIFICIDDNEYNIPNYDNIIPIIKINNKECEDNGFKNTVIYCKNKACSRDKALYYFSRKYNKPFNYIWFIEEDVFFYDINTIINIDNKYNGDLLSESNIILNNYDDINKWPHWNRVINETNNILTFPFSKSMICAVRISNKLLKLINNYAEKNKILFMDEALFNTLALQNNLIIINPEELKYITYRDTFNLDNVTNTKYMYHPIKDIEYQSIIRKKLIRQ